KDILTLAVSLIKEYNRKHNLGVESISIAALQGLEKLNWKKNIKQLREVIRKAIILANADIGTIWIEHIPVPLKLKKKLEYPRADFKDYHPKPYLARIIPAGKARQYHLLPMSIKGRELTVAMPDPSDFSLIKQIESWTQLEVKAVMAEQKEIEKTQSRLYGKTANFEQLIKQAVPAKGGDQITVLPKQVDVSTREDLQDLAEQAPVIGLVNRIIAKAIHERASDIHLETCANALRIRYRIDGCLYHAMDFPVELSQAVVSRIKVISNMDIASKRQPHDGRVELAVDNRAIDLRVATIPTMYGENVVMRVLDREKGLKTLDRIGLSEQNLYQMKSLVKKPHGLILVTGPTGSGKTSTLYAALREVNDMSKKIITVEDPIEYQIEPINQVQVNPRAGLTFVSGLRSILRLDPDIIMIGEIRDHETAELAVRAALTGHLVFSTLHTNDAPGAITRLIDMGIEPFLLSSSLTAIIGQRLVRLTCPGCKTEYRPPRELVSAMGIREDTVFYRGTGCPECRSSGYRGRTAIHELLVITDRIRDLTLKRASGKEIRLAALAANMVPMKKHGIEKVSRGLTTIEEVLSVTDGVESVPITDLLTAHSSSRLTSAISEHIEQLKPGLIHTIPAVAAP
ncbi:MAG: ATPase, T2SS/T4P/T4SS family, partial [bacterium]|nr:ATPase, T2SS/T4P/T4SS family [bacterium]